MKARPAAGTGDLVRERRPRRPIEVEDADDAAFLRQPPHDRGTDAVGAAGHEHAAALQSAHGDAAYAVCPRPAALDRPASMRVAS